MTKLLLDGDLFCYRSAASAENDDIGIAKHYVDKLLDNCLVDLNATEFQFYLTGSTNFRFQVYPEYKLARANVPKPKHLSALRDYVMERYSGIMSDGCEADDLMGIAQCAESATHRTIIVSLDKDMLMIPGQHYSWHIEGGPVDKRWVREAKLQDISPQQGIKWFYTQLLMGDTTDGIKGVKGIGKVGANRMLSDPDLTEEDMFSMARDAYGCDAEMLLNAQCLWIWRKENDIWQWPEFDGHIPFIPA